MKCFALFIALAGLLLPTVKAERGLSDSAARRVTLSQFLAMVAASNLDYAAQRYNVSISQAQLVAARVSPNPTIQYVYGRDVSGEQQPTTYNGGLTQTIETAGKRGFRTTVAQKNLLAASATLEDFFRTLRGTAANAYIDAIAAQLIVGEKRRAYESLDRLAAANAKRLQVGEVGEVDVNQARVDALQAQGDLIAAESIEKSNTLALVQLLGKPNAAPPTPADGLEMPARAFNLSRLLADALQKRSDIVAARRTLESMQASIRLTRANRIPDVTFGITAQNNTASTNPIDLTPNFNSMTFSASLPVPLFNSYRGEYQAAIQTALQAEKTLRSIELKAEVDVRQNYSRYQFSAERLAQYQGAALDLAEKVLEAKLISYQQGAAPLLDVLTARKANTDVHLAAIDAQTEHAKALVALEQAAGIWDLDL
jgi:outer membrane protein TolC